MDTVEIANNIAAAIEAVEAPTDDRPAWIQALNDADLVSNEQAAEEFLANEHRNYMLKTAQYRNDADLMRAEIARRIHANGGTQLPHDEYEVKLEIKTELQKRIDVLKRLQPLLPEDEYAKAIYIKTVVTEIADGTKINALLRKYGPNSEVGKVIAEGCPRVAIGMPKLIITQRPQMQRAA